MAEVRLRVSTVHPLRWNPMLAGVSYSTYSHHSVDDHESK